jgi:hypothetical protein
VGAARRGRKIVLTGDTRPCEATVAAAWDADLLVHEATFADDEAERARETGHSTAAEAARIAQGASARRLVLTHLSARYSRDWGLLEEEARAIFANTQVARDGLEIELPLSDELRTTSRAADGATGARRHEPCAHQGHLRWRCAPRPAVPRGADGGVPAPRRSAAAARGCPESPAESARGDRCDRSPRT